MALRDSWLEIVIGGVVCACGWGWGGWAAFSGARPEEEVLRGAATALSVRFARNEWQPRDVAQGLHALQGLGGQDWGMSAALVPPCGF